MIYNIQIKVMPLKELLDPQGKAVIGSLKNLDIHSVQDIRIGKHITLQIEAESENAAKEIAETTATKLLANPVMEYFEIELA
ncbi:phosphoribosylformylglycinamidine synthase subunit PurS [Arachidicoccus sp.]|jgi:phosphoribosylformylglycinamidine synthase|uniref:phosphoribosylformylglycinamidine synthase subunit PurS n=1 Tax=Arachidicoccus sp. TaxID=1872624 RepID=UPI003D220AE2